MNTLSQACGIIILLTLIAFFGVRKKLLFHSQRTFLLMLVLMLATHVLDLLSIWMIVNHYDAFPVLTALLCKAYLVFLCLCVNCVVIYLSHDIFSQRQIFLQKTIPQLIFAALCIVVTFALPIKIYNQGNHLYTYGPAANVTCLIVLLHILQVFYRITRHWARMNPDRRTAVAAWMMLWLIAGVIQFLFPQLLLISFAGSIGMLILYIKLGDPSIHLDKQSGLFNQNALIDYTQQMYADGTSFALIFITLSNLIESLCGTKFRWERAATIFPLHQATVFRRSADEIVLIFPDAQRAKMWETSFQVQIRKTYDLDRLYLRRAYWASLSDSSLFSCEEDLSYFLKQIAFFQPINAQRNGYGHFIADEAAILDMRREKEVAQLIDEALSHNRVEAYFQPIYSTVTHRFNSAEALMRLRDENGKLISPGEFIPVAEKNGKIVELGQVMFEQVCRLIREKPLSELGFTHIEVNLSMVQCVDENLARNYIHIMDKHGIDPKCINFELTESAPLTREDIFKSNLDALQSYGVSFSLDDFGSGQSNLNYIVDMPVSIVKFGKSMIDAFFSDDKAHYVMDAAMHMIHGMGLKIVAEGIETEEQYQRMDEMGITYIQGYYFSRPLPRQEFLAFIERNRQ